MKLLLFIHFADSEKVFVDLVAPLGAVHLVWDDGKEKKRGTSAIEWGDFPVNQYQRHLSELSIMSADLVCRQVIYSVSILGSFVHQVRVFLVGRFQLKLPHRHTHFTLS